MSVMDRHHMTPAKTAWLCAGALLTGVLFTQVPTASAACGDNPEPGVDWSRCEKEKKILQGQNLERGKFIQTDFNGGNLAEVNFSGAILIRANFMRASLKDANLEGADLAKAIGHRALFQHANMTAAILTKAEMSRAKFTGANLTFANLSKADLSRANLAESELRRADFRFANISRALFKGATINETNFEGAYTLLTHFEGVDLTKAKGLTQPQIDIACGDEDTKLPAGLTRPADWPCDYDGE